MNAGITCGSTAFCCGVVCLIVSSDFLASATNPPSFPPLSRRPSVVPSMASRSNVFGVSMGVSCGVIIASGANPPALACHSISSIIFISSCKLEVDFGRFHQRMSEDA